MHAEGARFEGKGKELKDAFKDAWDKTPKEPDKWYTAEISVRGENPIRDYRVVLS
jgi:hypothetical protein